MSESPTMPEDAKVSSKRKLTPHPEYEDYADRDDEWVRQRKRDIDETSEKKSFGGAKETFPIKLHAMLTRLQEPAETSLVDWLPHGRAFKVINRRSFEKVVLPKYFRYQSEYLSFQRQLNVYGFLRMTGVGPDNNAYYHPLLLRGKPELATLISRNRCAPHSTRRTFDVKTEPCFYAMIPLPNPPKYIENKGEPTLEHMASPSKFTAKQMSTCVPSQEAPSGFVLTGDMPYATTTAAATTTTTSEPLIDSSGFSTHPASGVGTGSIVSVNPTQLQYNGCTLGRVSSHLSAIPSNQAMRQSANQEREQRTEYSAEGVPSLQYYKSDPNSHLLLTYAAPASRLPQQSLHNMSAIPSNQAMRQSANQEREQRTEYSAEGVPSLQYYKSDPNSHLLLTYAAPASRLPQQSLHNSMLSRTHAAPFVSQSDGAEPFAKRFRSNGNDHPPQLTSFAGVDTAGIDSSHLMDVNSNWLETTDFNTFW